VFLLFFEEMGFSPVIRGPLWLSPTTKKLVILFLRTYLYASLFYKAGEEFLFFDSSFKFALTDNGTQD
jgi:hypothetical protein